MLNKFIQKFKSIGRETTPAHTAVESRESRLSRELEIPLEAIKMAQDLQYTDPLYWCLDALQITKADLDFLKKFKKAKEDEKIELIFGKVSPSFQHFITGMKKVYIDNKKAQRNSWKWLDPIEHRRNACKMLADDPSPEHLLQAAVFAYYAMFTTQTRLKDMIAQEDLDRISNTGKKWQPKNIYSSTSKQPETEVVPTTMLSKSEPNSEPENPHQAD